MPGLPWSGQVETAWPEHVVASEQAYLASLSFKSTQFKLHPLFDPLPLPLSRSSDSDAR